MLSKYLTASQCTCKCNYICARKYSTVFPVATLRQVILLNIMHRSLLTTSTCGKGSEESEDRNYLRSQVTFGFTVPIFTELVTTQYFSFNSYCTKFNQNRKKNIENTGKYSFASLRNLCFSLHRFSQKSQLFTTLHENLHSISHLVAKF